MIRTLELSGREPAPCVPVARPGAPVDRPVAPVDRRGARARPQNGEVRGRHAARPRATPGATRSREWRNWLVVVAAGIIVGCVGLGLARSPEAVKPPPAAAKLARPASRAGPAGTANSSPAPETSPILASGTTDPEGRLTRIVGNDPSAVLRYYCAAGGALDFRTPIGVRTGPVAKRGFRLGVLRRGAEQREYAIRIQADRRTGKWFVGDGRNPVPVSLVSDTAF